MQRNPKLLMIIGAICLVLIVGLFWSGGQSQKISDKPGVKQQQIKDQASGDTENEVLRTVLANQEQLKAQNQTLKEENEQLHKNGIHDVYTKFQVFKAKLEEEIGQLKSAFKEKTFLLQKTKEPLRNKDQAGFEIDGSDLLTGQGTKEHTIGTISDLSATFGGNINNNQPAGLPFINSTPDKKTSASDLEKESVGNIVPQNQLEKNITPYYTIPANSTLNHVKLMTAVIGEVPVSGKLVEPAFAFKAIIGRKELYAANGIELPRDLAGTVVQGYSVGNMALSCARMYVTRILFVFNDGHFVVYPKHDDDEAATSLYPHNSLGYLSDSYGNTCLVGQYLTDAPKVLANLALFSGISTGANAIASSQFTTVNSGQSITSALTGSLPKLVGASIVGGGSQEVLQWYKARVSDVFDAVYIPASFKHRPTDLVFNITKTIPIDLDEKGRTLRYAHSHAFSGDFGQLD